MGRKLMRVPLDFKHPINKIWPGYEPLNAKDKIHWWKDFEGVYICKECERVYKECNQSKPYCFNHPDNKKIWYYDPPKGEGYQLWETTTEGTPVSPVFKTMEKLAKWTEKNITFFGERFSKEEWLEAWNEK